MTEKLNINFSPDESSMSGSLVRHWDQLQMQAHERSMAIYFEDGPDEDTSGASEAIAEQDGETVTPRFGDVQNILSQPDTEV